MGFEVESAFPCATRLLVVGKRDTGCDAPVKVHSGATVMWPSFRMENKDPIH